MQKNLVISIIIAVIIFVGQHAYGQSVYIPQFDPVNDDIMILIAKGYLNDITVLERPWLRGDVIRSIVNAKQMFDPESEKQAVSILNRLEAAQSRISKQLFGDVNLGLDIRGLSREQRGGYFLLRGRYINRGFKSEIGSVYKAGLWLSNDEKWGVDTRLIFDSDGTGYPWYYGRAHNARIIGQFDHAYVYFNISYFEFVLGRQRLNWGPSPRGSLFLNDGSPPFDLLGASFELKPFKVTWFGSRIDDYFDPDTGLKNNRFISGHRLSVKPADNWEIAASEIVLYGGVNRLPELYYNIPLVLYYWEAQNRKIDDNVIWAFDVSYTKKKLGRLYLQFVADDIQYESNGPQKFAFQAGGHLVPSKLPGWSGIFELNLVDTFVFSQRQRRNAYLNWGEAIGRLDSDQLELFAGIYNNISGAFVLGAEFTHRQRGEHNAAIITPEPLPFDEKFPSGVVERLHDFSVNIKWNGHRKLYFNGSAGYEKIINFENNAGHNFGQFYSSFDISYTFDMGLPLWTRYH